MWGCGPYRISVERSGGRQWYRLRLGSSVLADGLRSPAELERELVRYGLTFDRFEERNGS